MTLWFMTRVGPFSLVISQLSFVLLEFLSLLIRQILILHLSLDVDELLLGGLPRSPVGDRLVGDIVPKYP